MGGSTNDNDTIFLQIFFYNDTIEISRPNASQGDNRGHDNNQHYTPVVWISKPITFRSEKANITSTTIAMTIDISTEMKTPKTSTTILKIMERNTGAQFRNPLGHFAFSSYGVIHARDPG